MLVDVGVLLDDLRHADRRQLEQPAAGAGLRAASAPSSVQATLTATDAPA